MTIWDNIYKNYQNGGTAWATLAEDIDLRFKNFLSQSIFPMKSAFDIGCGTGKYLKFLQLNDFKTTGIDSSETAVEMTKTLLGNNSPIFCASMFDFEIPLNKYDLIVSISTIHHGTKLQVNSLVDKIYTALPINGKIFITLPDFESSKKWHTFKDHEELASGTYTPLSGPEKGLAHSFYTKKEIEDLFSKFQDIVLDLDEIGRWFIMATK